MELTVHFVGLRIGYGAFPRGIIEYLWRAKQPYNVSVAAELAACAALSNPGYLKVTQFSHLLSRNFRIADLSSLTDGEGFAHRRAGAAVRYPTAVLVPDPISVCSKFYSLSVSFNELLSDLCRTFYLHSRVEGRDAFELKELLAAEGIMVRHYMSPASISGCIRVSVGKPEHTEALRKVLETL